MLKLIALLICLIASPAFAGDLSGTHAERESLGNGKFRTTIHSAPIAYQEQAGGEFKRIDANFVDGDATYPHKVELSQLKVHVGLDGSRKFLPTSDPEKYMLLGRPYTLNASLQWVPVDFGTPVRDGNKLTWTKAAGIVTMTHIGHGVKHEIELLGGYVPRQSKFAYPLTLQGLTRQGTKLLDGETVVANLQKPVVYDAANPQDVRQITYSFESLNGTTPAVVSTLPDLTGMVRPIVDPTVTLQPDGTGASDNLLEAAVGTNNYGLNLNIVVGGNDAAAIPMRGLYKINDLTSLTNIWNRATTISLMFYCESEKDTSDRVVGVHRGLTQWWEGDKLGTALDPATDGSTWNLRNNNGAVVWEGGAGGGSGTDYTAIATDSQTITGTTAWYTYNVKNDVQAWMAGTATNYGWWLINTAETTIGSRKRFTASDGVTAANRPKLVIEYTVGGSGVVASGSVTQANMKLSTVAGTAFVDFTTVEPFSGYEGLKLTITSVTGGGTITGYIKAMGTAETLDSELFTDPPFDNAGAWSAATGWSVAGGKAIAAMLASGSITETVVVDSGWLLEMVITSDAVTGGSFYAYIDNANVEPSFNTSGTKTRYRTRSASNVHGIRGFNGSAGTFTDISLKKVLTPSATGCTIVDAADSVVYNWTSTTGTFTLNDAAGYTYTIERPGGGGAIWFTAP